MRALGTGYAMSDNLVVIKLAQGMEVDSRLSKQMDQVRLTPSDFTKNKLTKLAEVI